MVLKMKILGMRIKFIFCLYTLCLAACIDKQVNKSRVTTLPFYDEATFTPKWMSPYDKALDTFHSISPFILTNQDGKKITEKTFNDKIYVVDFFFTVCPGICPKMTDNMLLLQDEFINDDEVLLLSHSVTPERDSVPVLKRYAKNKGIVSNKWHIVTGSQEDIYRLGRQDYFVEESLGLEKDEDEFLHTENFVLVDQNKHIRGIYNGLNKTSINQLIEDIKTLQKEG